MTENTNTLLAVEGLSTQYRTDSGPIRAVDDNSITVDEGEVLGVVGESGSGKSSLIRSIMRLLPDNGDIVDGAARFKGRDLSEMSESDLREIRGNEISMIFQHPISHLNPAYTIGDQIEDVLQAHTDLDEAERWDRIHTTLEQLGIPAPEERAKNYPHEFSGGMAQRVAIAMALICQPDLVLADEPTSALDVTIQAQIIDLLSDLQDELDMSIIWVTHDMGVVAEVSDTVAVMYAGNVVEYGPVREIFEAPKHPYTRALLETVPRHDRDRSERFNTISGSPPDLSDLPTGCVFQDRCPDEMDICGEHRPQYYRFDTEREDEHLAKCFLHADQPRVPPSPSAPTDIRMENGEFVVGGDSDVEDGGPTHRSAQTDGDSR
ncbi:ABC transporter ATP-binding protein [Haloplanus sp. GCM10025708]|uniref:ABC transporter ATP-binding protein n=1 Tax=Haloferacaceae TaxID=1644056 RepID=UPI003617D212